MAECSSGPASYEVGPDCHRRQIDLAPGSDRVSLRSWPQIEGLAWRWSGQKS